MEDAYKRFNSYDFETDDKFQHGLALVDGSGAPGLDIKLFYYNRFIEPIDSAGYTQWSRGDPGQIDYDTEHQSEMLSESEPGIRGHDSGEPEAKVLSFKEVMRLVQAGESVPGLVAHLDITPSNQNPTPSKMERVLKPWETR